jgi:hypothetical protein
MFLIFITKGLGIHALNDVFDVSQKLFENINFNNLVLYSIYQMIKFIVHIFPNIFLEYMQIIKLSIK